MNRKADFFYKTNRFESIRLKWIGQSIRIANRNALDETTRDAVSAVTDDVYSSQDYITAEVTPVD